MMCDAEVEMVCRGICLCREGQHAALDVDHSTRTLQIESLEVLNFISDP